MPGAQLAMEQIHQILLGHPLAIEMERLAGGRNGALVADAVSIVERPPADGPVDDLEVARIEFEIGLLGQFSWNSSREAGFALEHACEVRAPSRA